jgi:hypothetical protein
MPNWCFNWASIRHEDVDKIKQVESAMAENNLFETFAPIGEWDHYKAIEKWGTKWDVNSAYVKSVSSDNRSLDVSFDTAWEPPTEFYEKLTEQGFVVDATYHEPGMCFAGHYTSENGDNSYDYDFSDKNWRDDIDDVDVVNLLEAEYESYLQSEFLIYHNSKLK